jgi:chemotaxis methyl-accepting protein methylase
MEKTMGASLRSFDYAAYMRSKNETIGELAYIKAVNEGKRGDSLKEFSQKYANEIDDNIEKIADEYGKYVTFQDDNILSRKRFWTWRYDIEISANASCYFNACIRI